MRPLECSLGILAIISGLILLIPGLSAFLKKKINPEILELRLAQPALLMHRENWDSLDTARRSLMAVK